MSNDQIQIPQLYRKADVARALGVTEKAVEWMVYKGELPTPVKINGRNTWMAETITAWLEAKFAAVKNTAA